MQLCKVRLRDGQVYAAGLMNGYVQLLEESSDVKSLSDILHSDDPAKVAMRSQWQEARAISVADVTLLPPLDNQEVWAAGVTYKRSQEARERESAGAARFYDLVYSAPRPELFFKAPASRVVGHGEAVHIRRDSKWSVPEPELALVVSPKLQIVGYTIGNDMSSRDIEGENPLYLPQAKFYDRSCSIGPAITLAEVMPPAPEVIIQMSIERAGKQVFHGTTNLGVMKRSLEEIVHWLGRETSFPQGAILLTGTGIVPPDDFALAKGDIVAIEITGIGRLVNHVEQRA